MLKREINTSNYNSSIHYPQVYFKLLINEGCKQQDNGIQNAVYNELNIAHFGPWSWFPHVKKIKERQKLATVQISFM